jgi:hypothetical protein
LGEVANQIDLRRGLLYQIWVVNLLFSCPETDNTMEASIVDCDKWLKVNFLPI